MKKNIFIILLLLLYSLIFANENKNIVIENKYSVLIVPFIDNSEKSEYNHLTGVIQNALKSELNKFDKFNFLDETSLRKNYIRKIKNKKEIIVKRLKMMANNRNAHILIFGAYEIINEEIIIEVNIADIYYEGKVEKIIFKGGSGLDLFRIIDETAVSISEKIIRKIQRSELIKNYEFSLGFGFSHCGLTQYRFNEKPYPGFLASTNFTVSFPVSMIFYPNKNFGFGLTYVFGIGYYMFLNLNFTNKLKFVNKIGNLKRRMFFVLEYGVTIDNGLFYDFSENPNTKTLFYIGPNFFTGYEMQYKRKSVVFLTGIYFESLYGTYYEIVSNDEYNNPHWNFNYGIEFRWRFGFAKKK